MITLFTFVIALIATLFMRGRLDIRSIAVASLAAIAGYIHPALYPLPFGLLLLKTERKRNVLVDTIKKHPVLVMFLPISHGSYLAGISPLIRDTIAALEDEGMVPAGVYALFSLLDQLEEKLPQNLIPVYQGTSHLPPEEQETMYTILTTTALTEIMTDKARREIAIASAVATVSVFLLAGSLVLSVALRLFQ